MNLTDLTTNVRNSISREVAAFSDARVVDAINVAQRRLAEMRTWQEMKLIYETPSAVDQMRYELPTRMKELYSVSWIDGSSSRVLTGSAPEEFDKACAYPENRTGTPSTFVLYADHILLWRVPDAIKTLRMRCGIYPENLSGTDTSDLNEKDHLIIPLAVHECLLQLGELEDAATWHRDVFMSRFAESLVRDRRYHSLSWDSRGRGFHRMATAINPEVPLT